MSDTTLVTLQDNNLNNLIKYLKRVANATCVLAIVFVMILLTMQYQVKQLREQRDALLIELHQIKSTCVEFEYGDIVEGEFILRDPMED